MPKKEKNTFFSNGKKYYKRMFKGKMFTAKTEEELERKILEYKTMLSFGKPELADITIGEYIIMWYGKKQKEVQKVTAVPYKYASVEIIERIGKVKLSDSTPALLENCVKEFANTKLKTTDNYPSQKYINALITVLRMVYKQAKKELIFNQNFAEDISVKSKSTRKGTGHRALNEEEINRILNFESRTRPYALFMLLCGLMPEETVPLLWSDITYNEDTNMYYVSVNKTAELSSSKKTVVRLGKTKNEFRKRTVPIPSPLDEWIENEMPKHKKTDLIFSNRDGNLLSASALKSRWNTYLKDMDIHYNQKKNKYDKTRSPAERELSIEKFTQYDLRHTYATLLASIDTPIRKTTALMGHAEVSTTDKYYIDFKKIDSSEEVKQLETKLQEISSKSFK